MIAYVLDYAPTCSHESAEQENTLDLPLGLIKPWSNASFQALFAQLRELPVINSAALTRAPGSLLFTLLRPSQGSMAPQASQASQPFQGMDLPMQSSTQERVLEFMTSPPLTGWPPTEALPQPENKQGSSKRKRYDKGERLANVGLGPLRLRWGQTDHEGGTSASGGDEQLIKTARRYDLDVPLGMGIRMKIMMEGDEASMPLKTKEEWKEFLKDQMDSDSPPLPLPEASSLPPPAPESPPSWVLRPQAVPTVGSVGPCGSAYFHENNILATWKETHRDVKGKGGEALIQKSARLDIDMPFNTLSLKIMVERDLDGPHEQAYFEDMAKADDSELPSPKPLTLVLQSDSTVAQSKNHCTGMQPGAEADCCESQILPSPLPSTCAEDGESQICESQRE